LIDKQNNVSCAMIEYLLKWFLTSCEWLNACVALERTLVVLYETRFSHLTSKRLSKWFIIIVLISISIISSPELFFRRIITDIQDGRTWCVLTLNKHQPKFLILYIVSNVFLFLLPLIINLISGIIIIIGTFLSKQKSRLHLATDIKNKNKSNRKFNEIKEHIMKHKRILIGPVVLACLGIPRILFLFIFICTKLDQHPYPSLLGYLIGFLPSMSVLFVFILPSHVYRLALLSFIKTILLKRIKNWPLLQRISFFKRFTGI